MYYKVCAECLRSYMSTHVGACEKCGCNKFLVPEGDAGAKSAVEPIVMPGRDVVDGAGRKAVLIEPDLLEDIREDLYELLANNSWRKGTTKRNDGYLTILQKEIDKVNELISLSEE